MKSWKTTVCGLIAGCAGAIAAGTDVSPVVKQIAGVIAGLFTYLLGLSARDNNKSSEAVGAKILPLLFILLVPAALSGCKSPEQTAYRTIGTTATLVDTSMKAWGDYVRAGKATFKDESIVRSAYVKYQEAMRIAQTAYRSAANAPDGQQAYLTALDSAGAAASDIVDLIEQLTGKGKAP